MNTLELKNMLSNLFRKKMINFDVIASDLLLNYKQGPFPLALIVNSRESTHEGEHWIAIYWKEKSKPIEFFCSYGLGISFYSDYFKDFFANLQVVQNTIQLQSETSKVCGLYAVYYLWKRIHNQSLQSIYCGFSKNNYNYNDVLVTNFVKRFYCKK